MMNALKSALSPLSQVVILTGAGISAESGIRTFRDSNGLWEDHAIEDVATPQGFARDPALVHRFYNARRQQLSHPDVQPNAAHYALAQLEQILGDKLLLVTQNVDDLHERAGSQSVLHMHGELLRAKCSSSAISMPIVNDLTPLSTCACCTRPRPLRPDIVWFGEMPYHMDKIEEALWQADIFVSIGTSGNVYPAAGFVQLASQAGAYCIELNLEPSQGQSLFDEKHYGPASALVPAFLASLRSRVAAC
jgi:NAD-dependent deacetylase